MDNHDSWFPAAAPPRTLSNGRACNPVCLRYRYVANPEARLSGAVLGEVVGPDALWCLRRVGGGHAVLTEPWLLSPYSRQGPVRAPSSQGDRSPL